jgi:sulfate adenylyltransferase
MSRVQTAPGSLPQYLPGTRELDDVELLRMGALAPTQGFGEAERPVTLEVPAAVAMRAQEAGALELVDPEGVPLAVLILDRAEPVSDDVMSLIGPIRALPGIIRRPFGELYAPPSETKASLDRAVLSVAVAAPLTVSDLDDIRQRAGSTPVLFIVMAGIGTPVGVSAHGLIRATLVAAESFKESHVVVVPIAARRESEDDAEFRATVVAAYAPGPEILWPAGVGELPNDIAVVVERDRPSGLDQGLVVFLTGLSGSGKSTLAEALRDHVLENGIRTISLLDGDRVRRNLSAGLTFSPEDRETNIERIGWVAAEISRHGGMVICSPIAPFDRTRRRAREMAQEVGSAFVLIHVATPLEECERRDRKGLYAKARRGEIEQFTGISSPYEVPGDADLRIDTVGRSVGEVLTAILELLKSRGHLA